MAASGPQAKVWTPLGKREYIPLPRRDSQPLPEMQWMQCGPSEDCDSSEKGSHWPPSASQRPAPAGAARHSAGVQKSRRRGGGDCNGAEQSGEMVHQTSEGTVSAAMATTVSYPPILTPQYKAAQ